MKLEQLKEKLKNKGWFSRDKKKILPKFPRRIGVISSPTGAVIRDIIQVLSRRTSDFHLILNPVRVQGAGASGEIAQAIEQFNRYKLVDVLIVGRGGGSIEDLWAFNEEGVAQAIFESEIPIVSAVGHETDITLADFVADVRAPTPSAAAEIVSAEKIQHLQYLVKMKQSITHAFHHQIKSYRIQLDGYKRHPVLAAPYTLLAEPMQRLDELKVHLNTAIRQITLNRRYLLVGMQKRAFALKPTTHFVHLRQRLNQLRNSLDYSYQNLLALKRQTLKEVMKGLRALDPKNVLRRGYSILFSLNDGSAIVSIQELTREKKIRALLSDGEVVLKVVDDERKKL